MGTVDKLTFIKLNGPPPGMMKNREMLKRALQIHFKSDYAKHFINRTGFRNATSKVVERILSPPVENILPCFT